ncbi:hypothetical protein J1N35_000885 [Gossypium stocksii]|uniref:Reverse transcriptase zinc-binding domain-containing protein n=1 Tax=Gossypium stocksii TaxID=47602 RepID=A0A9D3WGL8_9ROSI|nr:hypothetical protein J1N35_000885 [Gossypium stocksii]
MEVCNFGLYLGVPLFHDKATNNTLRFIVDKLMMIPKSLSEEIEYMVRQLIWSSYNGAKKMALVSWDWVCQLKLHGGLGLRHLKDHNTFFMMKVLRLMYGVQSRLPKSLSRGCCSFLWRSLTKVWPLIRENLPWFVGDGKCINCWRDALFPNIGLLYKQIPSCSNLDMDCPLSNMITNDDSWNLNFFWLWVTEEIINKIVEIPPLHSSSGPDRII